MFDHDGYGGVQEAHRFRDVRNEVKVSLAVERLRTRQLVGLKHLAIEW